MQVLEHYRVADLTTMRAGGMARFFARITTKEELLEAVQFAQEKKLRLKAIGAGSNVVFSDNEFSGLVLKIDIRGINTRIEKTSVHVVAGAGEPWDEFVGTMIQSGFFGLENLSLIPGTVGAAPVQNIGAYGVEIASLIESVVVFNTETHAIETLSALQCCFGYRDSIFKHKEGTHYVVISVAFILQTEFIKNTSYPDLVRWESERGMLLNATHVRDAVIAIRTAKLPDSRVVATAGSFWKNPILSESHARALVERFPGLPVFPAENGFLKVSLAWLLDRVLGKKGFRKGTVGLYEKQALALVSYGATAREIDIFAHEIEQEVKEKFSINVEREVEFVL